MADSDSDSPEPDSGLSDEVKALLRKLVDAQGNGSIDGKRPDLKAIIALTQGAKATAEVLKEMAEAISFCRDGTITFDEMCTVIAGVVD
jgi:Ca2+-binding EF-hand superfamily protein